MITFTFEEIRAFKPRTVLRDEDNVDWIKNRDGFWYSADDVRSSYQMSHGEYILYHDPEGVA